MTFTGSDIKWISDSNAYSGIANVIIDGTLIATIDNYNTTSSSNKIVYQNNTLTNTTHTIRIESTGTKNLKSKGYTMSIDALEVAIVPVGIGKYEETNSALTFAGTWAKYTDISCSAGAEKYSTA